MSKPSLAQRFADLDELEVTIERLIAGGDGLARHQGLPIFVARSAPGDRLRVRLIERKPDYGRAEILEILEPGPGRRAAPCPYFARCGGCDLQHIEDGLQSRMKAAAVLETLARLGGIAPPESIDVITGDMWGYRLRTQLHLRRRDDRIEAGYFARASHDLVAVDRCPILVPALEQQLPLLPTLPALLAGEPPRRLDLAAGDDGAISAAPVTAGLPQGELAIEVAGVSYAFDARCFFQGHRSLLPRLIETVVGEASGDTAYDLYCGVGLFALPLARRYRRVVAVEGDSTAARFARTNARRNKVDNLEVVARALESWVRELPHAAARVVVDPPRAGMSVTVRRILLDRRAQRLTYVSCHPAALARDLRELLQGYRLASLALLDLFPQTGHMEAVVQLESL
jgi:23S rRNA (uracil1939-C5)-methyltransferase